MILVGLSIPATMALAMLSIALLLGFVELARGPRASDRVIALDLIVILAAGIAAIYSITAGQPILLDLAAVLGLISFLGTIAILLFIERRS